MTIDFADKYISSLQCIVEMQEEIMTHKKRIAEFEYSCKRLKATADEMIQVDILGHQPERTIEMDIAKMDDIVEEPLNDQMDIDQECQIITSEQSTDADILDKSIEIIEKVEKVPEITQMDTVKSLDLINVNALLIKMANDFSESVIQESLKEFQMMF